VEEECGEERVEEECGEERVVEECGEECDQECGEHVRRESKRGKQKWRAKMGSINPKTLKYP
jgi:hypothetical protein